MLPLFLLSQMAFHPVSAGIDSACQIAVDTVQVSYMEPSGYFKCHSVPYIYGTMMCDHGLTKRQLKRSFVQIYRDDSLLSMDIIESRHYYRSLSFALDRFTTRKSHAVVKRVRQGVFRIGLEARVVMRGHGARLTVGYCFEPGAYRVVVLREAGPRGVQRVTVAEGMLWIKTD